MRRKFEELPRRDYVTACNDECCRVIDDLDAKIKKEKDERQRLRMLGQRNAIEHFAPVNFGISPEQGVWYGFLYPEIDENGTLHFTFCSRQSDLPPSAKC